MRLTTMTVDHREVLELLPWYVNGTLVGQERIKVEHHVNECLPCNAALQDERRLRSLVQNQMSLPIGPEHGIKNLLRHLDRGKPRRNFSLDARALGYGLAAALGGAVVWAYFALNSQRLQIAGEFSTLSSTTASATIRIDVVFFETPSSEELNELVADLGGNLITGPSDLGRYTIAIESTTASTLDELLATLRTNPNVRFAGPAFIDSLNEAEEVQ